MRPILFPGIAFLVVIGLLLAFAATVRWRRANRSKRTHVVLIGASIGQAWRLAGWPLRVHATEFTAESLAAWQFDKNDAVETILLRPKTRFAFSRAYLRSLLDPPPRPDLVILKECSSYFPGPLRDYQDRVSGWVTRLQHHQFRVALATVVPVTGARAARDAGKQESLLEFNAWVRHYAREHDLLLLDLEAALREESDEAYLQEDFAAPDGSHLNARAYARLDAVLLDALCGAANLSADCAASRRLIRDITHADR